MILGEVEETITTIEIDEETFEQIYRVKETFRDYFKELFHSSLANKTTNSNVICAW